MQSDLANNSVKVDAVSIPRAFCTPKLVENQNDFFPYTRRQIWVMEKKSEAECFCPNCLKRIIKKQHKLVSFDHCRPDSAQSNQSQSVSSNSGGSGHLFPQLINIGGLKIFYEFIFICFWGPSICHFELNLPSKMFAETYLELVKLLNPLFPPHIPPEYGKWQFLYLKEYLDICWIPFILIEIICNIY
jgi:hypothetical protein